MATYQLTIQEVANRNFALYLKGRIIGYSVRHGMKWSSKHASSPIFQLGYDEGIKPLKNDYSWTLIQDKSEITAIHIIYNNLRHNKPHTKSVENDEAILSRSDEEMLTAHAKVEALSQMKEEVKA